MLPSLLGGLLVGSLVTGVCSKACGNTTTTYTSFPTDTVAAPQVTLSLKAPDDYVLGGNAVSRPIPTARPTALCIVTPRGWGRDDSSQILAAVEKCGTDGVITLPAPYVYTVARRLHTKLKRAQLNIFGTLLYSSDMAYWIDNSHRIEFQNQSTAWIVEGEDYEISGGGWKQGGIDGNGQSWYGRAAGQSNQFGRPIPLSIYNSTNVTIQDFQIVQPQFWTFWIQDSNDISLRNVYVNGTNRDPYGNSTNYEINVDGLNSYRVNGLHVTGFNFRGGDDCLAMKGNSTNIDFHNATCIGGGIAFGSIGQYPESPDYIANVTASNITVTSQPDPDFGGAHVSGGAYFKTWVGVEMGEPPQGGGGGTGRVWNVSFSDLHVQDTRQAVYVNKCYYKVPEQAAYCDTSTLSFEDMNFSQLSGVVASEYGISLNCSAAAPCQNLNFEHVNLELADGTPAQVYCGNVEGISGVECNNE